MKQCDNRRLEFIGGPEDGRIVDTHDRSVSDPVWALYADAWRAGGPFPTLLEWDAEIPALPVLLRELERASEVGA